MILINNLNRSSLEEGRQFQMGFAFIKKTGDDSFETVQPISPCKDYLNDVVFSEHTGTDVQVYGLSYSKHSIFDGITSYMAISICNYKNDRGGYTNYQSDIKNLNDNFSNLERFMRYFDEKLHLNVKTSINKLEDNLFLVEFDYFWSKYTYLISLYSLLIRAGQFYKEGDPMDFLRNFKAFPSDSYLVRSALPKLNRILEGDIRNQNFSDLEDDSDVHDSGIINFNF